MGLCSGLVGSFLGSSGVISCLLGLSMNALGSTAEQWGALPSNG